jgi:hypothetical protein
MTKENPNHPFLLKLRQKFGKRFGREFEPDNYVRVIKRMGLYADARGPGMYNYDPATETLGTRIYVGGQRRDFQFADKLSYDGLPMTVRLNLLFKYNPRDAPTYAASLTAIADDARLNLLKIFVEWATNKAVNQRNSQELRQSATWEMMELEIRTLLLKDAKPLGFDFPGERPARILDVRPPEKLTERHVDDAQRRAHIVASEEFSPTDYRRVLIAEFMKEMAQSGRGESLIDFSELMNAYSAAPDPSAPARPRIIDQPAPPQPPPQNSPPGQKPPVPPSQPPKPRTGKRSRLE